MAERESLTERAYRTIRERIVEGRLAAGDPLSRRWLAAEMGMSRVPVAEALRRLADEGAVESRPSAGTRVRVPTAEDVRGCCLVCEALETHAARLFAESASQRDRVGLLVMARALDRGAGQDAATSARAHFDFHRLVAAGSGCRELVAAVERSRALLSNCLHSVSMPGAWLAPDRHSVLAAVLAQGAPDAAAEAMRAHLRDRQAELLDAVARRHGEAAPGHLARGPQRRTLETGRRTAIRHRQGA